MRNVGAPFEDDRVGVQPMWLCLLKFTFGLFNLTCILRSESWVGPRKAVRIGSAAASLLNDTLLKVFRIIYARGI